MDNIGLQRAVVAILLIVVGVEGEAVGDGRLVHGLDACIVEWIKGRYTVKVTVVVDRALVRLGFDCGFFALTLAGSASFQQWAC